MRVEVEPEDDVKAEECQEEARTRGHDGNLDPRLGLRVYISPIWPNSGQPCRFKGVWDMNESRNQPRAGYYEVPKALVALDSLPIDSACEACLGP